MWWCELSQRAFRTHIHTLIHIFTHFPLSKCWHAKKFQTLGTSWIKSLKKFISSLLLYRYTICPQTSYICVRDFLLFFKFSFQAQYMCSFCFFWHFCKSDSRSPSVSCTQGYSILVRVLGAHVKSVFSNTRPVSSHRQK
jgi:hypothetical protein